MGYNWGSGTRSEGSLYKSEHIRQPVIDEHNFSTDHLMFTLLRKFCNTAVMARLYGACVSTIFFVLLGLAACIMMATSAPNVQTMHVRQATSAAVHLNSGVRLSVSYCKVTESSSLKYTWLLLTIYSCNIAYRFCKHIPISTPLRGTQCLVII